MPARSAQPILSTACILGLLCFSDALLADTPTIENQQLNESSGLAFSTRSDGILFSHNDSGDEPRLFCFDRQGKTLGEIHVSGAQAIDWEDMCSFKHEGKHWLAIADTGDNVKKRKTVSIYLIEEPQINKSERKYQVPVSCELRVTYATGSLDCEALAYDPLANALLLITKELTVCDFWRIPLPAELADVVEVRVESQLRLAIPYVTGADISRDGKQLAICTYGPACLIDRNLTDAEKPWSQHAERETLRYFPVPARKQGEAICFEPAGVHLWFTSEHVPTPLIKVKLPE